MGAEDDKTYLPVEPEAETSLEGRTQRGMAVRPSDYYETGRAVVGVGSDGMPVMQGPPPSPPDGGLTEEGLICNRGGDRVACRYYAALLLPADGVARGFDPPKQIRRFCTRLQTASELFEITDDLYACTLRDPPDPRSAALIEAFEEKQRQLQTDTAQTSAKLEL